MRTSNDYYDIYASDIKKQITDEKNVLAGYKRTRSYFLSQLRAYEDIIRRYCDLTFDEIVESTLSKTVDEYDKCMFTLTGGTQTNKDEAVRITSHIIEANRLIWRVEDHIKRLQNQLVDRRSYKMFLRTLNELLRDAIVYKGYEFNFTGHVSSIFIQRKKRYIKDDKADGMSTVHNRMPINWGESNKKKAEILARGGIPRKGDNGGEEWLVPFVDDYGYWVMWDKKKCHIPNKGLYSFQPARGLVLAVNQAKKDELIVANYISA